MNYIYDILLNFEKEFYDFYEWNPEDKLLHIKKIPIFKVSNEDFKSFKNSYVRFEKEFMYKIYNKAEKFTKSNHLNYVFLVSNGKECLGLKLNKNGINSYISSLLLDEEEDVANLANSLDLTTIKYTIVKIKNKYLFQTRKEKETKNAIIKKLNNLYQNKEKDKLKYLYLECFNKEEENILKIYNTLKKEIARNTKNCNKMYNFFKIIEQK